MLEFLKMLAVLSLGCVGGKFIGVFMPPFSHICIPFQMANIKI